MLPQHPHCLHQYYYTSDGGKSQPSFSALIKGFMYFLYRYLQNKADHMQHKELLINEEWELGSPKRKWEAILKWKARWECPHPRWHGNGKW